MNIAQDIIDLIVDQLSQSVHGWERERHLRAASLISTTWVNRSQHHLFSTVELRSSKDIQRWRSRIEPNLYGASRHVRVLVLGGNGKYAQQPPAVSEIKTALPHFTSFRYLRELEVCHIDLDYDIFVPIISSFASTLKRFQWTQKATHETWKTVETFADLLPNLAHIHLSSNRDDYEQALSEIKIRLSADKAKGPSRNAKHPKFHELRILHGIPRSLPFLESCGSRLQALDLSEFQMWEPRKHDHQDFQTLLEGCHALQVLSVGLYPGTARFLGLIPSDSVSLIHLDNPLRFGYAPMTYNDSWSWKSFEEFQLYLSDVEGYNVLSELMDLSISIRKIAQRFSDRHPGSKTRVRATLDLAESEVEAVEKGGIPLFKARLEEELGNCVELELILRPWSED